VVAGCGAEAPEDRLGAAHQQSEPDQLVRAPGTDVRGGHVPDVREFEGQQRGEAGGFQFGPQPGQPLVARRSMSIRASRSTWVEP
jgi:hypothetical protein